MPGTPDSVIAAHLRTMADSIVRDGLWLGGPNFADAATQAHDVPAAAYRAATGRLPFVFAYPTSEAMERARALILRTPAAMDTLRALAEHLARTWPDLDWTDDPIDRLANWPHLLGVHREEIPQTLRDLAQTLGAAATAPATA